MNARGQVTGKYFEDDYKERDTAAIVLMKQFGLQPGEPPVFRNAKHVQVGTSTSDSDVSMGQHLSLMLDVKLADRVHVYAPGVKGYIPIDWQLDQSPAFKPDPARYPESTILGLDAIQESVPVYQGEFRLVQDITIADEHAVGALLNPAGDLTIGGTFRYQACDDQKCYLPETVPLSWTLHYHRLDRERVPLEMQRSRPLPKPPSVQGPGSQGQ